MNATKKPTRTEEFGEKVMTVLNHAATGLMLSIGHRTGLFDTLSALPATTSARVAEAAGLSERYVREWLGAMVTAGVVEYEPEGRLYRLPPEHAAWLTRAAVPQNLAASAQFFAVLGSVEDEVVAAFRHGRGVPYQSYHRFHEVMAEESAQTVLAGLHEHILPLVPGLRERLQAGIDVVDVGCGSGRALNLLAANFPASRFTGCDFSEEAIAAANAEAVRLRLPNVRFVVRDVAEPFEPTSQDLITAFDAIHDQAKPDRVLRNIREALRPGGVFLMQDIMASSHLHQNCDHPFGPFLYTISCMHCMSVSLACGGPGLGAVWGKETALRMLREAGFGLVRVETLPHDAMNYYYVATPA
jgi:ubiquinone/menaquinone biosynthesis C-methylase UbiE